MFEGELSVNSTEGPERAVGQGTGAQTVVLAVRNRLAGLLHELDTGMVDVQVAPGLWKAFDSVEKLGAAGKLLLNRRVDQSGVAKAEGFRNTATYLARHGGRSQRAAVRALRASEQLAELPNTQAAVRQGTVSVDQAAAIADAATSDPEAERELLTMAGRVSLRELQDACLRVKAQADPDPDRTRRRQHRDRFLRHGRRPDGTFSLHAQGPPEHEGLLQAALRHGIEDRFRVRTGEDHDSGALDSHDQRAYDALFDILRNHVAEGPFVYSTKDGDREDDQRDGGGRDETSPGAHTGNEVSGVASAGPVLGQVCERCGLQEPPADRYGRAPNIRRRKRPRRRPNPTYMTLLRVDIEALNRGRQEGEEVCDMPGLGPISVPAARALLPDSIIRLILTRGQEVAAVVHAGRGPNTAQKMALNWMQPVCTVEGCSSQIVQADHRIDWATTRHTTLAELDHLCPHHHRLKTNKNWALVEGTGKRAFVPPDDSRHPGHSPASQSTDSEDTPDNHDPWSAAA